MARSARRNTLIGNSQRNQDKEFPVAKKPQGTGLDKTDIKTSSPTSKGGRSSVGGGIGSGGWRPSPSGGQSRASTKDNIRKAASRRKPALRKKQLRK